MSSCNRGVNELTGECTAWALSVAAECIEEGPVARQDCVDWADHGSNKCSAWADHGHNECCDWAPCSWFCDAYYWVSEWVCLGWYWASKWVCVGWEYIVEWACVAFSYLVEWVCIATSWAASWVCDIYTGAMCFLRDQVIARGFAALGRPASSNRKVEHVFVLMLENRSFDHVFGFSQIQGRDAHTGAATAANDLSVGSFSNVDPVTGETFPAKTPADYAIPGADRDPGHDFPDVLTQLAGAGATYPDANTGGYPIITGSGFVAAYRDRASANPGQIMNCFSAHQLPVINALAGEFAVCDAWYSSMPGPTWPNRFFVHAATSGGMDDHPPSVDVILNTSIAGFRFENGTIFDLLEDGCHGWSVYEGDELPQVFSLAGMNARVHRYEDFSEFVDDVADPEFEDAYVFIEPDYGNILPGTSEDFTCGNSQHPIDDMTRGEQLIKDTYEAIRNSPHWEKSVLVVTYDEHGGFFDHVQPPSATPPGDDWADPNQNQRGFDFSLLGIRVPTVIVSPLIPKGTIDHTAYDHSSIPKTLASLFNLDGPLTDRDRNANSFEHLLSLSTARTDTPLTLPDPAYSGHFCVTEPFGFPAGTVSTGQAEGTSRKPDTGTKARRRQTKERDHMRGQLRGFAHVALRKALAEANGRERRELVRQFKRLSTDEDARRFIYNAKRRYIRSRVRPITLKKAERSDRE